MSCDLMQCSGMSARSLLASLPACARDALHSHLPLSMQGAAFSAMRCCTKAQQGSVLRHAAGSCSAVTTRSTAARQLSWPGAGGRLAPAAQRYSGMAGAGSDARARPCPDGRTRVAPAIAACSASHQKPAPTAPPPRKGKASGAPRPAAQTPGRATGLAAPRPCTMQCGGGAAAPWLLHASMQAPAALNGLQTAPARAACPT